MACTCIKQPIIQLDTVLPCEHFCIVPIESDPCVIEIAHEGIMLPNLLCMYKN